jgi:hypothetical protein
MYPVVPAKTTIYFDDTEEPLNWDHNNGSLIKMAYNEDQISALYASNGDVAVIPDENSNIIVLQVHDKHLVDVTSEFRAYPERFVHYIDSALYKLDLFPTDVNAGRDRYSLAIRGLHDVSVRIVYALNDGPAEAFTVGLDAEGQATFNVSSGTRKGAYKFLGFNISGHDEWIRAGNTVTVH